MQCRSNHCRRMLLLLVIHVPTSVIVAINAESHHTQQLHREMPRVASLQLSKAHITGRTSHLSNQMCIIPHRRIVAIVHKASVQIQPARHGVFETRSGLLRNFRRAVQRKRMRRAPLRKHVPQGRVPIQKQVRTRHALGRTDGGLGAAARAGSTRRAPGVVGESGSHRTHELLGRARGFVVDVVEGGVQAEGGVRSAPERILGIVLSVDLLFFRRLRIDSAISLSIRTDNSSRIHRHEPLVQFTLPGQIRTQGSIVKEPKRRTPRLIHRIRSRGNIGKAR
mmetsp:Transcript_24581/g.47098  ORF Transcript_24581/g.47098 Transcript_24581/m.47098 type:complete len:280 (-) Transcript_24581:806-1645(-)